MVKFGTALKRCATGPEGLAGCPTHDLKGLRGWERGCGPYFYTWIKKPCTVAVQVHTDGSINIVEPIPEGSGSGRPGE
jgi:hypothetical protein